MAVPFIVGICFIVFGGLLTTFGFYSYIKSSGSKYNEEDVAALVAATRQEEERNRKEHDAMFDNFNFQPGMQPKMKKVLAAQATEHVQARGVGWGLEPRYNIDYEGLNPLFGDAIIPAIDIGGRCPFDQQQPHSGYILTPFTNSNHLDVTLDDVTNPAIGIGGR